MDKVFEKVQEIVSNTLDIDPEKITMESSFKDDLGADSLDTVEIILELEAEYGISVPDEIAAEIVTVGDAVEKISALQF